MDNSKDKKISPQEWATAAEKGIYNAIVLPLYSLWLGLFVWPGAVYLASVVNVDSPSYLGSVGLVVIVVIFMQLIKRKEIV
ncbi:hypothetical protein LCGC14_2856740 [marine sediment metagenome]|uniref:Uncharacterized protein n=1 Tax=marine sediment metagenome TaxID=412755 RepID=A0A0F8Y713_9ZZZZ